jgi:hypothetical protein
VFDLTGVNAELTVHAAITADDTGTADFVGGDDEIMSDGPGDDDERFRVFFTGTDIGDREEIELTFTVFLDDGDDLDLEPSIVNLAVALGPVADFDEDLPNILLFADNGVNADVFSINECLSFLLYHWTPNTGDGNYDTGMTFSNTGDAPAAIQTQSKQTGPCNVYFYSLDGTVPPESPVPVPALDPGETATMVVSEVLDDPFVGYAIAVCEFQWGHGFWFTNNPQPGTGGGFAQGSPATVLLNRKTGGSKVDESRGQ